MEGVTYKETNKQETSFIDTAASLGVGGCLLRETRRFPKKQIFRSVVQIKVGHHSHQGFGKICIPLIVLALYCASGQSL